MLLPTDINPYSFSLAVSTVTSPSLTTLILSLKTISRKSWRSSAHCLTTTTQGSTSAFISSPQQDTPSSPWTLSLWKNWTARYTHPDICGGFLHWLKAHSHTPSLFPLSVNSYHCCWNPTSHSLWPVCISLWLGDPWSFCWGVDSQYPRRVKYSCSDCTFTFHREGFQEKFTWHALGWSFLDITVEKV